MQEDLDTKLKISYIAAQSGIKQCREKIGGSWCTMEQEDKQKECKFLGQWPFE